MLRANEGGLSSPMGEGGAPEPPAGHSRVCWAAATGQAARDRPPEPPEANWARAQQLIADGFCQCAPLNKGSKRRRGRSW